MKPIFVMFIAVNLWLLQHSTMAAPLKVVSLQLPPMHYEEEGIIKGIAVDIVNEVFARMEQPITLRLYPFARSLNMIEDADADAIFAIVKTPEREQFLNYPDEVLINQTAILFARKDAQIHFDGDLRTLSGYRFGILRAATYGKQWEEATSTGIISKIDKVNSYPQNILKLASNRVDIVIGPRLSMLYAMKKLGYQNVAQELSPHIEVVPTYLAFSKTRVAPETIKLFERTLKALKEDGTYEKIVNSYIQ